MKRLNDTLLQLVKPQPVQEDMSEAIEALIAADECFAWMWGDCRMNPAKYQHLRIGNDTARSMLARIMRNVERIHYACGLGRR